MDQPTSQRWLAYELHDGLLQWIIGARLQLIAAKNREAPTIEHLQRAISRAIGSLEMSLAEARELIGYLEQQPGHDELRLLTALTQFIERARRDAELQRQQIVAQLKPDGLQSGSVSLTDTQSWNLLRIAQQAVRNAISHAGPAQIGVALRYDPTTRGLELSVTDNGRGFERATKPSGSPHFGLDSMAHRAQLIGAKLLIDSAVGEGCRVRCTLNL